MRNFFCIFLLLILYVDNCYSQDSITHIFHLSKLPPEGTLLDKDWKFQSGDNPDYAKPDYEDSKWQSINPTLDVHDSLPQISRRGIICWFRLRLSMDTGLLKNQLALIIEQSGASEIYLNGRLIQRFGQLSTNPKEIKAYDPFDKPVLFPISGDNQQVLAVRYALQPDIFYTKTAGRQNPGLMVRVNNLETSIDQYQHKYTGFTASVIFRVGVFLILSILHFAFYVFYPSKKANLYFCLYAVTILVNEFTTTGFQHEVKDIFYANNFSAATFQIANFFILTAIYFLFAQKKVVVYWSLFVLTITSVFLNIWSYHWGWMISVFIVYTLINIEIVRISFISVKNKKRGAWIIATGSVSFLIFWLFFLLAISLNYVFFLPLGSTFILGDLIYNLTALSIPVATSIYLGLDFAFTSRELKNKLLEVQKLSTEKQQILTSQKETLEQQVTERTSELKHSLENLKSTQAQLIQSEKMASLGELTAGIAHEIQNPLNFVNNFSEVNSELISEMKDELAKGNIVEAKKISDDINENEQKIIFHGKRADAIVKGMLQHSRSSSGVKEPTDINALADEYLRLAYHGLRAKDKSFNATMKTDYDQTIGLVNIVPQEIGRVILNLIMNAFYTVTEKKKTTDDGYEPTVTINTKHSLSFGEGRGEVQVKVKDNGNGIPQKILDKIFQPFFTTKPTGQGTGLGLSLAYDIIKAHGGEIKVETKEAEGSEFIIRLPLKENI